MIRFEEDDKRTKSVQEPRNFVKFDIKESLKTMIEKTNLLNSRRNSKLGTKTDNLSNSLSKSRSKSIPKPEKLEVQPESLDITIVNKELKLHGILKKKESSKFIGSGMPIVLIV